MQPQTKSDGFLPKWTNFHPQSILWVENPFEHDVLFNVADEHNNPYQYKMPAGKISELPGGAVATLGVKAIVDELIQTSPVDLHSMWEVGVRKKYEDQIIKKIKEAPSNVTERDTGIVNLGMNEDTLQEDEDVVLEDEQAVFPTKPRRGRPSLATSSLASKKDVVLEDA